ncbi:hypothetical protein [Massilia aquatica]|uniref:Uncharacterized protein n=1 Tax=Massilia aquatica TaxID=2609000 RepID=A0ABX0M2H5_9BURK|nr:hypothetical protein [Massilia aquatica]NHZ40808.1 hypothetical protein [Massilia aquatica]
MQHSEPTSGSPANVAPLSGAVAPWLACGPVLDVPAAMAALAMPSRRFPGTPACADPDRAWELFLTHARAARKPEFDRCEPEFVAAARQADARVEQGVRAGSLLSDAVMLGMSTLFEDRLARSDGSPFVDFLVAERGLPYALEVLLTGVEKMRIDVDDKRLGQPWCVGAAGQQWQFSRHRGSFSMAELAYRGHLAHASDDIWMQCVQAIRNCLERVPPHRQVLLALLLPDVPEVSDALVMEREYDLRSFDFWLNLTVSAPVREQTLALRARMMAMLPGSLGGECQYHSEPFAVATLLQEYGADAVALLAPGVTVRVTDEALLCIGTPEAVAALARGLTGKYNKAAVLDRLRAAVSRWPYAALAGLAELSATDGPIPLAGRSLLATLVSEHAAQLPAFKPWISEQAAAVLDDFAARFALAGQIADPADLPPVLANPPWLKPRKKTLAALALAPLPLTPAEHWTADQREDMRSEERYSAYPWNARRFAAPEQAAAAIEAGDLDALLAIWQACVGDGHYLGGCVHAIVDMPEPYNAAVWNALAQHPINSPGYAVATLGLRGLPGLVAMCERRPADDLVYAQYIAAIELAAPVARALATLKTYTVRAAGCWPTPNTRPAACSRRHWARLAERANMPLPPCA